MKKVYYFVLTAFFTVMATADVMAVEAIRRVLGYSDGNVPAPPSGGGDVVGAPLDGGLLALLAAAGFTYFVARKKKKNKE